jgi:hypothetical protein
MDVLALAVRERLPPLNLLRLSSLPVGNQPRSRHANLHTLQVQLNDPFSQLFLPERVISQV